MDREHRWERVKLAYDALTRTPSRAASGQDAFQRHYDAPASDYREGTIVLRRDAFERWLWSSAEGWNAARGEGPMGAALAAYGWHDDRRGAIARMAGAQHETLLLHEIGEHRAGLALGPDWEAWFGGIGDARDERLARAVRDLLADCLVTLPALAERRDEPSLHFWFATFGGLRRALFPRLAGTYGRRAGPVAWTAIAAACREGADHWMDAARQLPGEPSGSHTDRAVERLRLV